MHLVGFYCKDIRSTNILIREEVRYFSLLQNVQIGFWSHSTSYVVFNVYRRSLQVLSDRSLKFSSHHHLAPRVKKENSCKSTPPTYIIGADREFTFYDKINTNWKQRNIINMELNKYFLIREMD